MNQLSRDEHRRQLRQSWQTIIGEWRQSNLSQVEYCRRHNLNYNQFIYWKKRLIYSTPATVKFVPVAIRSADPVEQRIANGALKVLIGDRFKNSVFRGFCKQKTRMNTGLCFL
jgi:hypothetical protein